MSKLRRVASLARGKELSSAFGWTPVRIGIVHSLKGLKQGHGDAEPKYATRENITIAPYTDMSVQWAEEKRLQETMLYSPHVLLNVASFDPLSWILVRFTLWVQVLEERGAHAGMQYLKLLHLAAPAPDH